MSALLALAIKFWKPLAMVLGAIVLMTVVGIAKHRYDDGKREEGRAEIQAKWDADKAERIKRTTEITNLWDSKRQEAEKNAEDRDHERRLRADLATVAARGLPPAVARIVVPHSAVSVLDRAIDAGSATQIAGPAREPAKASAPAAEGADSTVGLLTQWGVQCIAAYEEARGMVVGWQDFYQSLRGSQ